MQQRHYEHAETLIHDIGARLTRPRIAVLTVLLAAEWALTHHETEKRLNRAGGIDRVTVYRVLDWLTANGLAHKIAGDDRTWRYNAAGHEHAREHAHFKCSRCGTVICLDEPAVRPAVKLPPGFRSQQVELTIKGVCAGCGPSRRRPPAQHRR